MIRRTALARTPFVRKPRRRKARVHVLVPKVLAVSAIDKGPARSESHLALVRRQACLITGSAWDEGWNVVAHHPDELFPSVQRAGQRISDYLVVPLVWRLHDPATPGSVHHADTGLLPKIGEQRPTASWWARKGMAKPAVLRWLKGFLEAAYPEPDEQVRQALEVVKRELGRR